MFYRIQERDCIDWLIYTDCQLRIDSCLFAGIYEWCFVAIYTTGAETIDLKTDK